MKTKTFQKAFYLHRFSNSFCPAQFQLQAELVLFYSHLIQSPTLLFLGPRRISCSDQLVDTLDKTTWGGMGCETCVIWSVDTTPGVSFDLHACHNLIQPLVLIKVNLSQSILYKTRLKILFFIESSELSPGSKL